ncbi:MAG: hypothetical protein ACK5LT_01750 [Lachnospirales bacterium]
MGEEYTPLIYEYICLICNIIEKIFFVAVIGLWIYLLYDQYHNDFMDFLLYLLIGPIVLRVAYAIYLIVKAIVMLALFAVVCVIVAIIITVRTIVKIVKKIIGWIKPKPEPEPIREYTPEEREYIEKKMQEWKDSVITIYP